MKNISKFPTTSTAHYKPTIPGASTTKSTPSKSGVPTTEYTKPASQKSWQTLHTQFVQYGRNAKEWLRKCILLLPQIEKQQIWRKKRFKDIYEYAAKLAGMSHNQVNEALRILRKTEEFPILREVIEEKGINAVRPILSIVTKETEKFWAEKALIIPKHPLEAYVRAIREGRISENFEPQSSLFGRPGTAVQSVNLQNVTNLQLHLSAQNLEPAKVTIAIQLEPAVADEFNKIKGQSDWNETIKELLKLRRQKLEAEKPQTVVVKQITESKKSPGKFSSKVTFAKQKTYHSRKSPAAIKKYVLAKTNSTCAFPGCTKPSRRQICIVPNTRSRHARSIMPRTSRPGPFRPYRKRRKTTTILENSQLPRSKQPKISD